MLYILDQDPDAAALFLADDDLRNAIPIVISFLCAAHVLCDGLPRARERIEGLIFHVDRPFNPFAVWAAQANENYNWSFDFGYACILQLEQRGKQHSLRKLAEILANQPEKIQVASLMPPPCLVPASFRKNSLIENYRDAYFKETTKPNWSDPASTPQWFSDRFAMLIRGE